MADEQVAESRVFLTLYRRNLAPREPEHWDAVWEQPHAAQPVLEERGRILDDDEAFAWARARSRSVYVTVAVEPGPGRYWAGEGQPPELDLPLWQGRPPLDPAPTVGERKLAYWRERADGGSA